MAQHGNSILTGIPLSTWAERMFNHPPRFLVMDEISDFGPKQRDQVFAAAVASGVQLGKTVVMSRTIFDKPRSRRIQTRTKGKRKLKRIQREMWQRMTDFTEQTIADAFGVPREELARWR